MTSISPTFSASSRSFCDNRDIDHDQPGPDDRGRDGSSVAADAGAGTAAAGDSFERRYPIQRSASSDARLPSPIEEEDDRRSYVYDDSIPCLTYGVRSSLSLSSSNDHEGSWDHHDDDGIVGAEMLRRATSVPQQRNHPVPPSSAPSTSRRRDSPLQTIESEKCLVDLSATKPLPPPPSTRRRRERYPSPSPRRRRGGNHRQDSEGSHESLVSHYSADAGKHGFLAHPPHPPPPDASSSPSSIASGAIDSCCGGGGGGGDYSCDDSLVFKYTPGRETPPANYALPASILRVYGDDADDLLLLPDPPSFVDGGGGSFDSSVVTSGEMGIVAPRWRADSDGGGSRASSIVFVDATTTTGGASASVAPSPVVGGRKSLTWSSSSSGGERTGSGGCSNGANGMATTGGLDSVGARAGGGGRSFLRPPPPPSSSLKSIHHAANDAPDSSRVRTAHMIALLAEEEDDEGGRGDRHMWGRKSSSRSSTPTRQQQRILPYHERKRLTRLRAERKRRKKVAARNSRVTSRQQAIDEEERSTTTNDGKGRTADAGERSPMNCDPNGYGGTDDSNSYLNHERGNIGNGDVDNNEVSATNVTKGWFEGLVALVTGQDGTSTTGAANDEENQPIPKQRNSYREQADAFLKRTERERTMMKEQCMRSNNLQGGHRSRRSTGSATLDSIASCSDYDEDDGDDETCSSDEGSDSCYLDDDGARRNANATSGGVMAPSAPARVWKYGEPPTVSDLAKKKTSPRRDRVMRRERLLQEECDYRLHTFKRRHDAISKKFRVFVLVAVGIIFVGILGIAFAVCVRMLTSL